MVQDRGTRGLGSISGRPVWVLRKSKKNKKTKKTKQNKSKKTWAVDHLKNLLRASRFFRWSRTGGPPKAGKTVSATRRVKSRWGQNGL